MQEYIIDNTEDKMHKSIFTALLKNVHKKTEKLERVIRHTWVQRGLYFSSSKFPAGV